MYSELSLLEYFPTLCCVQFKLKIKNWNIIDIFRVESLSPIELKATFPPFLTVTALQC